MTEIDQIDWEIVALLNEDGRMTSAEIARRLDIVSSRTVSNRIEALIEQGIIQIRAIVDPNAVGYGVLADVFIKVEPGHLREIAEIVARYPIVSYVACATGESDVSISVRSRTIEELFNFVTEELGKIPGVRGTQIHLLPVKIKDLASWLPPTVYATLAESDKVDLEDPSGNSR